MKKIIFTNEQVKEIITLYTIDKLSMKAIGEKYGVSKTVINRILMENNISKKQDNHIYQCNYDYFENIDSDEKAYWLGFLAADGCNYRRETNATILLNIHQKDSDHLIKFQASLNSNIPIKNSIQNDGFSNNTPMSRFAINSMKMSKDLEKLGIVPRKSLILKPPIIDEKYYLPFILGYFDGDGSICKLKQYNNYEWSIQGTKEMLNWINSVLQLDCKLRQRNPNSNLNNYYISIGGTNKIYNILYKLYNSCNIHLERKYLIYKELETVVLKRNFK